MRRLILGFTLVALAVPAFAKTQQFSPERNGTISFATPKGNIRCIYIPKGGTDHYQPVGGGPELQCDRMGPGYVRLVLHKTGRAKKIVNPLGPISGGHGSHVQFSADIGDVERNGFVMPSLSGNVLKIGRQWKKGAFSCKSEVKGLTCTRDSHHFFIGARLK
jgi:hypothetical protein